MFILEVKNNIEVETPRGKGRILYITEYGMEIEKMFTVAIDDSGEIWEFTNRDIRMVSNLTFGRKLPRRSPEYFQEQGTAIPAPRKNSSTEEASTEAPKKEEVKEKKAPKHKILDRKIPIVNEDYSVPSTDENTFPKTNGNSTTNGITLNGNASMRPSIH